MRNCKKFVAVTCAAIVGMFSLTNTSIAASSLSNVYVFGDSTIDSGNLYALTGGTFPSSSQGYVQGRWTNGYNYADQLSLAITGSPTSASVTGGNDYGYGGARVVSNFDGLPDLSEQLSSYASVSGGVADPNALYVLNFGGNDIFAMIGLLGDPAAFDAYRADLIQQYSQGVSFLDSLGARNILVMGIPAADFLPFTLLLNPDFQTALDGLSLNGATHLYRYDFFGFTNRIAANPASFGLPADLDSSTYCQAVITPAPGMDCSHFSRFDDFGHFTAPVHTALFNDINAQFGFVKDGAAVPEPEIWMFLLLGFALAGHQLRSRMRAGLAENLG
jgi:phospholipase/lecithinase/hemolysin